MPPGGTAYTKGKHQFQQCQELLPQHDLPKTGFARLFPMLSFLDAMIINVYDRCCIKITFFRLTVFLYTSVYPTSSPSSSSISLHLCLLEGFPGSVVKCVDTKHFLTLSPHACAMTSWPSTLDVSVICHHQSLGILLHQCTVSDTSE